MVSIEAPQGRHDDSATEIELRANSPIDESLLDINLVRPELIFDFGIEHDVLLCDSTAATPRTKRVLWNVEVPPPSARSASEGVRNWKSHIPRPSLGPFARDFPHRTSLRRELLLPWPHQDRRTCRCTVARQFLQGLVLPPAQQRRWMEPRVAWLAAG